MRHMCSSLARSRSSCSVISGGIIYWTSHPAIEIVPEVQDDVRARTLVSPVHVSRYKPLAVAVVAALPLLMLVTGTAT